MVLVILIAIAYLANIIHIIYVSTGSLLYLELLILSLKVFKLAIVVICPFL
jgi:hypothetical protein